MGKRAWQITPGRYDKWFVKRSRDGKRHGRSGDGHSYVKRETRRYRRRLEKQLLDDTPKIVVKGWEH